MVKIIFNSLQYLRRKYWKFFKIETFGIRAVVLDGDKILLVKHRYGDYWVMPGGGIKKGDDPEKTVIKELHEETGIIVKNVAFKLGYYKNTTGGKNDNVHCYVVSDWEFDNQYKKRVVDLIEIGSMKWFGIKDLPAETSPATKNRIAEYLEGKRGLIGVW